MTFRHTALAALALFAAAPAAHAATFLNGSFETGDFSGWAATPGFTEVVTEADDAIASPPFGEHYDPVAGAFFARLTAGVDLGVYTVLSQSFTLATTGKVSGAAAFLAFDYLPYDDDAFVRVTSALTNEVVFASSVAAVGDYGHTPWTSFSTGTLAAGAYVFEAAVRDNVDFGGSSQLLLDAVSVTTFGTPGVPEPASWALMILGFGGTGALLRARRRALPAA